MEVRSFSRNKNGSQKVMHSYEIIQAFSITTTTTTTT